MLTAMLSKNISGLAQVDQKRNFGVSIWEGSRGMVPQHLTQNILFYTSTKNKKLAP